MASTPAPCALRPSARVPTGPAVTAGGGEGGPHRYLQRVSHFGGSRKEPLLIPYASGPFSCYGFMLPAISDARGHWAVTQTYQAL